MTQTAITDNAALQQRGMQIASGAMHQPLAKAHSQPLFVTLVAIYIFLLESRVLDLSPIWWMHIPLLLLLLLIIMTAAKGELRVTFHSKISIAFALFTAWVAISVPFSKWRAASIGPLETQIQALVIFVIMVQAIRTPEAYRKITGAYAYAIFVASLLSFHYGRSVENGRLALAGGTFGDPNEFALALVVGLPFWWDKANASTGVKKIYCFLCTAPILISFGKTGSRSGLFALLTLVAVTFFLASAGRKMFIIAGCGILVLGASFFLPEYIRARYQTIFSPAHDQQLAARDAQHLSSDIASSEERKRLLIESIQMTFENPIFGVGPGVFSYAGFDERKASTGHGGIAQVTHNTYTQVSSETGLPGFFFFLATTIMVLNSSLHAYRGLAATNPVLATSGRYLFCLLVAFAVGIFFLSVGYTHTVSTLFALAVALTNLKQAASQESKGGGEQRAANMTRRAPMPAQSAAAAKPVSPEIAPVARPVANSKALRTAGVANKRNRVDASVRQ